MFRMQLTTAAFS